MDKAALEGLPERERKRQEARYFVTQMQATLTHIGYHQAIFEFIATEAAYVRDLQLIVEVRVIPNLSSARLT